MFYTGFMFPQVPPAETQIQDTNTQCPVLLYSPGDRFTSIDLQDAYFHKSIYLAHKKFLTFAFQGIDYEYQTPPSCHLPRGSSVSVLRPGPQCQSRQEHSVSHSEYRIFVSF